MKPITLGLALAALPLLVSAARADGAAPSLSHTAPFLGHDLTLTVDGAPPFASVRLYESPAAGQRLLPFGLFELDSAGLVLVAQGGADANGAFVVTLALPADPAQAETERHYQALVTDPAAPAGAVLSEARHLRILGPRAYVGYAGQDWGGPFPGGLAIVSAIAPALVATVDYGAPTLSGQARGDGEPVFTPDFARGAIMASPSELVLFDPFSGGILARVPFDEASRTLCVAPGGELCVLETGMGSASPRFHALDFETGNALAVHDLPHASPGLWVTDPDGTAYVAELDTVTGKPWIRRFDLADPASQDAFRVGVPRSYGFQDLCWAADQLFVSTSSPYSTFQTQSELSRVSLTIDPPPVVVEPFPVQAYLRNLTPAPDAGMLLFTTSWDDVPGGDFKKTRLAQPSASLSLGYPGAVLATTDIALRGTEAWVLLYSADHDHADWIYRLDLLTSTWTFVGFPPCGDYEAAVAVEVLQDAYVDQVVYAVEACVFVADPVLVFHDPATGAEVGVPLGYGPDSLRVVSVP